jgi:hypothetical protein
VNRTESIFECVPESRKIVTEGVLRDGSDLAGVNAKILWVEKPVMIFGSSKVNLLR